jgi:hypothetical protein
MDVLLSTDFTMFYFINIEIVQHLFQIFIL